jgi:hypothetical protein
MQHSIKFNHDAPKVGETFGLDLEGFTPKLAELIRDFMHGDEYTKRSHLVELIADRFSQEEILFLALEQVEVVIKEFEKKIEKINDVLGQIIGNDED